jgi:hypothetical protein
MNPSLDAKDGEMPKHLFKTLPILTLLTLLGACATPVHKDYSTFRAANPRSILVVPPVNRTVDVDAPSYFLSTLPIPLAERGYYTFPVHMVKRVMEDDGLSDADMVHNAPTERLAKLFGADAVLYISIERWDARYAVLASTVTVDAIFTLKSGHDGSILWEEKRRKVYQSQSGGGGSLIGTLIVAAVSAAVKAADPDYMPLARQASHEAVSLPGTGLPAGPHHASHGKDHSEF